MSRHPATAQWAGKRGFAALRRVTGDGPRRYARLPRSSHRDRGAGRDDCPPAAVAAYLGGYGCARSGPLATRRADARGVLNHTGVLDDPRALALLTRR